MTSLGEVQRIIGLSLSKIQMGRNQRGGLPLHKNLLVATVLNKARDVYMQETMYMNYRLMACGQFNQEEHEDIEDDDTPDTEDYEEDSESDVEDDNDSSASKDYCKEFVGSSSCVPSLGSTSAVGRVETPPTPAAPPVPSPAPASSSSSSSSSSCCVAGGDGSNLSVAGGSTGQQSAENTCAPVITNDEGFIDESDCDCDTRNFSEDGETRVPFQYCFSCAPFHPSNGRGPTLVGPQLPHNSSCAGQSVIQEQEDKLIYDMDSKSTQNQSTVKRKRQISSEETEDAINSILPKKRRDSNANQEESLDDSGFQEEEKVIKIGEIIFRRGVMLIMFLSRSSIRPSVTAPATAWRSTRSPASSPSSPSGSSCSAQPRAAPPPAVVGPGLGPARGRRAQKTVMILTVTVTPAVTADTPVMTTRRTLSRLRAVMPAGPVWQPLKSQTLM